MLQITFKFSDLWFIFCLGQPKSIKKHFPGHYIQSWRKFKDFSRTVSIQWLRGDWVPIWNFNVCSTSLQLPILPLGRETMHILTEMTGIGLPVHVEMKIKMKWLLMAQGYPPDKLITKFSCSTTASCNIKSAYSQLRTLRGL